MSGSATGTINYSFFWNCSSATTDLAQAQSSCGALPAPSPGSCTTNIVGAKCDAIASTNETVSHTYPQGVYTPKVIVERDSAPNAQAQALVTAGSLFSHLTCLSNTCTRVSGPGANTCSPEGVFCVSASHLECASGFCTRIQGAGLNTCAPEGSACVAGPPPIGGPVSCSFSASPSTVVPPQATKLSWTCQNAASCTINGAPVSSVVSGSTLTGSASRQPSKTTTYTLSCTGPGGSDTKSATVIVASPGIKEINP